jgi:hypothetical protein
MPDNSRLGRFVKQAERAHKQLVSKIIKGRDDLFKKLKENINSLNIGISAKWYKDGTTRFLP